MRIDFIDIPHFAGVDLPEATQRSGVDGFAFGFG
jgi:hypothetical protein